LGSARWSTEGQVALIARIWLGRHTQLVKILGRSETDEASRRSKMHGDRLPISQQVPDILERSATFPVPKHEAIGGVLGHLLVFHRIEIEATSSPGCVHTADLPIPDIFAEHPCHCIDDDSLVCSGRQMLLNCPIRTVGIADKHPKAAVEEFVKF
jgi:hypothetical protein